VGVGVGVLVAPPGAKTLISVTLLKVFTVFMCPTYRTYRASTGGKSKGCSSVVVPLVWAAVSIGSQLVPSEECSRSNVLRRSLPRYTAIDTRETVRAIPRS
jgi:hypothetical protein